MREPNTMYSPHRVVTPAPTQGVTIEEIKDFIHALYPDERFDWRRVSLLFAILKVGCSIPKLEDFTRWPRPMLQAEVERLRMRGHLFTGQLSTHWVLSQVPGSEDLIERITGQRIIKKESSKMAIPAEDKPHDEPAPPKRKYKKRAPKAPKGDGTLRIKKAVSAASVALTKARNSKAKVSFSILYMDNETHYEKSGDSMEKLLAALGTVRSLNSEEGEE